jgi:hypothetical protein
MVMPMASNKTYGMTKKSSTVKCRNNSLAAVQEPRKLIRYSNETIGLLDWFLSGFTVAISLTLNTFIRVINQTRYDESERDVMTSLTYMCVHENNLR